MLKGNRFALLGLLAVAASSASAVVWRNDRTDAQMLAFGADARFAGVGQLFVGGGFGSATYLGFGNGSHWLLTAKHVIGTGQTGTFKFFGGPSFGVTGTIGLAGVDISVAKITGWNLSAPLYSLNMGATVPGTHIVSAGYGGSCPESQAGNYNFDDKRRGFETLIDSVDGSNQVIDRFQAPGDPLCQNLEGFGAPGDSGSALIGDDGRIYGVLTGGQLEQYGNINWYAGLNATTSAQIYSLTGISQVPEPMSLTALGLGALALIRRRRSRQS